jgi:hypothetical protein
MYVVGHATCVCLHRVREGNGYMFVLHYVHLLLSFNPLVHGQTVNYLTVIAGLVLVMWGSDRFEEPPLWMSPLLTLSGATLLLCGWDISDSYLELQFLSPLTLMASIGYLAAAVHMLRRKSWTLGWAFAALGSLLLYWTSMLTVVFGFPMEVNVFTNRLSVALLAVVSVLIITTGATAAMWLVAEHKQRRSSTPSGGSNGPDDQGTPCMTADSEPSPWARPNSTPGGTDEKANVTTA